MQYARHRVLMGERSHRVAWSSVSDLPAIPLACGRRMVRLNTDKSTRRAVMRLCNLLAERYTRYLNNACRARGKNSFNCGDLAKNSPDDIAEETVDRNTLGDRDGTQPSFQQTCWDDFEDPECKMAVEEVLRCKRMARLESTKGTSSRHGKCCPDTPLTEGTNMGVQENVSNQLTSLALH